MSYNLIKRVHRFEETAHRLGFRLAYPKHGWGDQARNDLVAIYPRDEELPIYARDAELYVGTLDDAEEWMQGIEWARNYDTMLIGKSINTKRERKEQDVRNKRLVSILKDEEPEFVEVEDAKP